MSDFDRRDELLQEHLEGEIDAAGAGTLILGADRIRISRRSPASRTP